MISVILCTYNRCRSLQGTLQSLADMTVPPALPWELVVVDNNSRDETRAVVDAFSLSSSLRVKYVFEGNQGLSYARNAGIREARGDILSFIDDDVTVDPGWLGSIQETFEKTGCAGVGGKIVPVWPCPKPSWLNEDGTHRLMGAIVDFDLGDESFQLEGPPIGANMSFTRASFEKYGAFRTDLGRVGGNLMGLEDTEFGRRLLRGKEPLMYAPGAIVYHPVEKERISKAYFQSWYFSYGRASIRLHGLPKSTPYFGVPKTFFRSLLLQLWRGASALGTPWTFYYKLRLCLVLGQIAEAYETSRRDRESARSSREARFKDDSAS